MNELRGSTRRNVLKTIGAGVTGGTVLTGSATASPGQGTDIYLRGHNFTPNQANVRLGGEGSATVRWTNDEVNYFGEGFPVPHDVHLHHEDGHLVESGIFTQMSSFNAPDLGSVPLGPTFYEVEFREEGNDLVIEETGGKVASTGFENWPPYDLIEDYDSATIEDWGGSVTLDVHCSLHSVALNVNEGELVTRTIKSEDTEPPYELHLGFFKMDGGLTITR
ncbi:hypothetical protein G9464_02690 [Halostella sp. JP-L12]|uniref:hypothetical protein n=1 Tax=Halostella TaxID=1843185 RepID=UPI0013CE6F4D|nr:MULTISPECIES: hypothetical protein [Halostella]NHN46504.1 hypothetical protein [Halostella sp. JP-L12]